MNKIILPLFYITFTSIALKFILKWKYKKKINFLQNEELSPKYYHQCRFINMKQFQCLRHLLESIECCDDCAFAIVNEITTFISSAKHSICICMYFLSLKQVNFAIIDAKKRGLRVSVITDHVMIKTDVMQKNIKRLQKYGIICKIQPSSQNLMHHKFCLIDKEDPGLGKVLFGSLNFTLQALTKNFDAFIITNNPNILNKFAEEFEELWKEFKNVELLNV